MPRGSTRPTYIDLFAGCGGASVGFHEAGFDCLLAVDWDQKAVDCYNENFPRRRGRTAAVRADLSKLSTRELVRDFLEENGVHEGCCDVIVGGPPCQSFSNVGQTKVKALTRTDERLRAEWDKTAQSRIMLYQVFALFVEVLAPRWILFENVPTIRSHDIYPKLVERFNGLETAEGAPLEYVFARENYWASDYGVPQRRRRFLMVGYRKDLGISTWQRPDKNPGPNVGDAIDDLPTVPAGFQNAVTAYDSPLSDYQTLMRAHVPETEANIVTSHICRSHNPDDIELFRRMRQGARFSDEAVQEAIHAVNPEHKLKKYSSEKFQDKLHKLDPKKPAWTVTAHLQKDCYKFIHYRDARTITVREAARLQSFPDHFKLPTVMGVGFRVVGNAIPPLLAQAFARSFCKSDSQIGSIDGRARALIPDAVWNRLSALAAEEFPAQRRGPKAVPVRVVFAAAVLSWHKGWKYADVAEYFGYSKTTIEKKLRQVFSSGLWDYAERLLAETRPVYTQAELELPIEHPHDVAAD
jgi:DNA (cytosine-5)-methyltransferase 1